MGKKNMKTKVSVLPMIGWDWAKRLALRTIGKTPKTPPSRDFKLFSLLAEHSHIKVVQWCIDIDNLRQWVGVHLLRHPFQLPFICSQRCDRQEDADKVAEEVLSFIKEDIINDPSFDKSSWRDYRLQGSTNDHSFVVNAQTLINISKKRLCKLASKETREVWQLVVDAIKENDPEVGEVLVPHCVYRGFCPERETCGFYKTKKFAEEVERYRNLIGR